MIQRILLSMVVALCTAISISVFYTIADLYVGVEGHIAQVVAPPDTWHHRMADMMLLLLTPASAIVTFFFLIDDTQENTESSNEKQPLK